MLERFNNDGPALGPGTFGDVVDGFIVVCGDGLESRR